MRDHVRYLMQSRGFELDFPSLFDSSNIKCLFGALDASSRGHITSQQFKSGALALLYYRLLCMWHVKSISINKQLYVELVHVA